MVRILLVAPACTLLLSHWASNRKEMLMALDNERKTAAQNFYFFTWVTGNLAFLLVGLKPTYIRLNLCLHVIVFFSSLHIECVNIRCQDVVTTSVFPWLPSVTELNHAWWGGIQLSTNLGWLTFDFAAIYRGLLLCLDNYKFHFI